MAKVLTNDELKALAIMPMALSMKRTGALPLDLSSLFASKADADLYAAGGTDSRGMGATAYVGQIVSVVENDVVTAYTVEADGTLKALTGELATDLADITTKVNAILNDSTGELDSFADVKAKFDSLPKDMVVSGGEVRVPNETELANAELDLEADEKYIILTIANAEEGKDKLYIKASDLVDVYTGSTYVSVSNTNVISLNVAETESKFIEDGFAKKTDIETATAPLATSESVNALEKKVDNNTTNITNVSKVVGDADSGLVKEVTTIKSELGNYTKTEDLGISTISGLQDALDAKVDKTTKVNDKALSGDITLAGSDIKVGGSGSASTSTISASVEDLYQKVAAAASAGVTSFGGKTGEISVDGTGTGTYKVALSVSDDKKLSASISGLGTAAAKNVGDFDPAGAADAVKTALVGTSEDVSDANTIAGAKKYADTVAATAASNVSVTATGDAYISTDGTSGKAIKVAATTKLANAVAKAESAVQAITESENNGKISVDGTDVAVHGLGTAAYTNGADYATAAQGRKADSAIQSVVAPTDDKYVTATKSGTTVTVSSKGIDTAISTATAGVKVSVTNGGYITGSVDSTGRVITLGSSTQAVSSATSSAKGLAEASDVKSYVDTAVANCAPTTLTWASFA